MLPHVLAGRPLEIPAAVSFAALLAGIFLAEILTPHDVVATMAVLPLLAAVVAMWLLSARAAALIGGLASGFFARPE